MVNIQDFKDWYSHSESNNSPALKLNIPADGLIQSFLNVSQSVILDMLGIDALTPRKSAGLVKITRSAGNAVIDVPAGTKFTTAGGLAFITSEDVSITQSKNFVETGVLAEKTGSQGNIQDGTILTSTIDNISVVAIGDFSQGQGAYDSLPNDDRVFQAVYLLCNFYIDNRSTQEITDNVKIDDIISSQKLSYYRQNVYPALIRQIVGMIGRFRNHSKFIPKVEPTVST